jgi:type I restriction enzyme S subunit
LLLTEGGDPDKLGRGSVWKNQIGKCIHQNHIFRVRINDLTELNPCYLSALIGSRYGKSYFLKSAKQTTGIASINSTQLKNFPTVIPPIDLQNQFAAIVEKVDTLKSRYQQSLTDLESLYGALSQKAFKGELDLSRVVLATERFNHERHEKREMEKMLPRGFARQLLAAEILHRHNSHNMTQMKLQKLIHLAEYHARLDEIRGEYQRQAAGPFDNKMMYGLAAGLKKQQWFAMIGRGQNAKYSSLTKAGNHERYLAHWRDQITKIDEVLALLGHASPDQCEIASTLYAAWNDLLIDGEEITDERIIEQASKAELWHKTKEAIDPERWPKALQWMRDHNLVPTGYGKHTRKLQ